MARYEPTYSKTQLRLARLLAWWEGVLGAIQDYRFKAAFAKAQKEPAPVNDNLVVMILDTNGTLLSTDHHGPVNPVNISRFINQSLRPYRREE
jgi:hypothetical protein